MGTDGSVGVYTPFWGSFKRDTQNFPSVALSQGPIALWAVALGCLAVGLLALSTLSGYGLPSWWVMLGLAAVAWSGGAPEEYGSPQALKSPSPFCQPSSLRSRSGPLPPAVVMALANLSDFRRPYLRWAVYTPARAITGVAAGFAASAVLHSSGSNFGRVLVAALGRWGSQFHESTS